MKWLFPDDTSVHEDLRAAVGGHPLVAEILSRRGVDAVDEALAFLDPDHYTPAPPTDLPDVDVAVTHLLEAIQRGQEILVWGDFDVDGQTSTTLLVDALRGLDARVRYQVPHRMQHGHGIDVPRLKEHIDAGVDLVLTCDTGIAAHEAVQVAKDAGVTMLITDHHALPDTLPDASALVNPQRLPAGHALRDLPGVGVTYKLVQHLYAQAGRAGDERDLLDLVALGIVADIATQRRDTRYLLQLGIDRLRNPQRVGLQALMRTAQVDPGNLSADTIGFQIGPRLNALGRLDDATLAVEMLTTSDETKALRIARQLNALNDRRKQIEDEIYQAAQAQIAKDPALAADFEVIVLAGEKWHPGVIGIVASRLVEHYNKPAVLLASPPGEIARGSARSVPGVDIGASIAANADLLVGHGGHPGAAGCALDPDLIPQFRRRLSNTIDKTRDRDVIVGLPIDAEVGLGDLSMELAKELNRLAPFGAGNPPVRLLTRRLTIVADAVFGAKKHHRRVTVEDEDGVSYMVTWWRGADSTLPGGVIDLVYIPRINDYKGRRSLQLEWVDSRPTPGVAIEVESAIAVVDLRAHEDPASELGEDLTVWAEGLAADELRDLPTSPGNVIDRGKVRRCDELVVWTVPPGLREIEQIVQQTGARTYYVIASHIPPDSPEAFLKRLTGLIRYALREYNGRVSVRRLAAITSQREVTVRRGLEWLTASGDISVEWEDGDGGIITPDGTRDEAEQVLVEEDLGALLQETRAFREVFLRSPLNSYFEH